ncbi:TPA: YhfG family protein [Escherichia coli]|nr:YhfG family protein [Escherichia coli]EHQ0015941.1 YhfG family protein [Escherichia coli]HDC4780854.1 YhfG family protein [Escherichia coli]HDS5567304.1 YhfG family protein [Escherichia coli]
MKKLTDKQKSRLWELQRNRNFQASRRLEGVEMPLVTLTAAEALARLEELRRHYERYIRRRARSVSLSWP